MCVENAWSSERKELVEGPPAAFRDNVWAKKTQSTSTPVCSGNTELIWHLQSKGTELKALWWKRSFIIPIKIN